MIDHIEATYSDIKTVKSRGVCQIVLEMPIEGMATAFDLLGAPVASETVWVVLARLRKPSTPAIEQQPEPEAHQIEGPANDDEPHKPRALSQVAAILCNIVAFRRFIHEKGGYEVIPTADEAATWVREKCGITSRRELDTDTAAAANFRRIRSDYDLWMRVPA